MQNVDPIEIRKFEELANRWWDPGSEFKPLHDINPLRANYIDHHSQGVSGKKLLDVGCGGGLLSEAMAHRGATVSGIDMGEGPLTVARLHSLESQLDIDYQQSSAEKFAEKNAGQFDIVCCLEMLEHVPDPGSVIQACADLCKPKGMLFFSTINRNPKSWAFAIAGAEYLLRLLPRGTHDFQKFIRPSELANDIRQAGLEMKDITGMTYNPFTRRYSLSQDVDVNYLVCCQKH